MLQEVVFFLLISFVFVVFPVNFLLVEYWIWYPLVCAACFFQISLKPFALAVFFLIDVPLGKIWKLFVTEPL